MSAVERLFPRQVLQDLDFSPFSAAAFKQLVLMPEAALRLIAEDRSVTLAQARQIALSSSKYGYCRFPYGAEDGSAADTASAEDVIRNNFRQMNAHQVWQFP